MTKGEMINAIYQTNLTKRATLVVFYLINRADKEMTCFPGVKTIAKECHISLRTVQRALNDLVDAGFLNKESRFHAQGGQRSNLYTLLMAEEVVCESNFYGSITFEDYSDEIVTGVEELEKNGENYTNEESLKSELIQDKINFNIERKTQFRSREANFIQDFQQYCHGG